MSHHEAHKMHRVGWMRAAVLGANDGIVSTASLIIGVAAAGAAHEYILIAGISGLVAGAMSMAAGEYVSVSSQADTERADLELERQSLEEDYEYEIQELAEIYERRGLQPALAREVAEELMAHDALGAHARDEIGISAHVSANPVQAALSSALTFFVGAALPLLVAALVRRCRACLRGCGCVAGLSIDPGSLGGLDRWRTPLHWRRSGAVLGDTRDGADRSDRKPVRRRCLARSAVRVVQLSIEKVHE